jgi:hypothetical protein
MIYQRINSCLIFCQGKCPHFTIMERYFLFPQILNAIDVELAEGNCLDCKKYIDRRALSTKSALGGETLHQRRTTMASEIEKRQHGRIAVRYLTRMVTSRSVMWKAKQRIWYGFGRWGFFWIPSAWWPTIYFVPHWEQAECELRDVIHSCAMIRVS